MFFYRAQRRGTWDKMQRMLVKKTRVAKGKKENPTYALIDLQSVKTTSASDKPAMTGEKKKGRKRHIVADMMENLLCYNKITESAR